MYYRLFLKPNYGPFYISHHLLMAANMSFEFSKCGAKSDSKDGLGLLRVNGFAFWKAVFLTGVTEFP